MQKQEKDHHSSVLPEKSNKSWRNDLSFLRNTLSIVISHTYPAASSFFAIDNGEAGLQKLRRDLETGAWERRYAELLTLDAYDAGYRLVVAG